MNQHEPRLDSYVASFPIVAVMAGLYLTSHYSFLLFHSLAEGISIAAAVGVFMVAWHSRRFLDNGYLTFIGIAYLFVGVFDMLHTLSYEGTGIFPGFSANLPAQLWLAARFLQAGSLLAAPFFIGRRVRYNYTLVVYILAAGVLLAGIFSCDVFPVCRVEGAGSTLFNKASEYLVVVVLLAAAAFLLRRRREFDPTVLRCLVSSILFTAVSELFFTNYLSDYSVAHLIGHYLKIIAFYLMYKAVIETGLVKPYDLLFRNLKQSEEALRDENDKLLTLQRQLAVKNDQLRGLNDLKNQFLGMAAHDLRTPLSVILAFSEFLNERAAGKLDQKELEYLSRIRSQSEFMLSLVDDLLNIAEIESGRLKLDPRPTDLDALVGRSVEANRALAEPKHIAIRFEVRGVSRPIPVDPARFEQILNNLLSNAIKFSHPGSAVEVRISHDGDGAVISVRDEGQGIPAGELDKVFNAFEKTSVKATGGEKSTGLGLAIVRRIAEGHGGRVWVESQVGKGTTFFISLPAGPEGSA